MSIITLFVNCVMRLPVQGLLTTYVTITGGLVIMQCEVLPAVAELLWFQRYPWIFILIALTSAAVLILLAWWVQFFVYK